jgi:hypothetical protein
MSSRAPNLRAARLAAVLAVATVALALAACGETENFIDQDSLESGVLDLAPANVEAESASCPEEVSSDKGTEFDCTVTTADGEVVVTATVISEGDEEVAFEVKDVTTAE